MFRTAVFILADSLPEPDTLLLTAQEKELWLQQWFVQTKSALLLAGIKCAITLILCAAFLYICKKIKWRNALITLLLQTGALLASLTLCFLFFHPVIRTLSQTADAWGVRLYYMGIAMIIAWCFLRGVSLLDQKVRSYAARNHNAPDDLSLDLAGNILRGTIIFLALLFIGQNIFELHISALLAGAGVIGLCVALASKETLANFFGTLVIAGDTPFRIGDRIKTGEIDGIVERVGIRSCRIRTRDESLHTVPNSILAANPISLISRKGLIKYCTTLGLVYRTTPQQLKSAKEILFRIAGDFHGTDQPEWKPHIYFAGFAPYALEIHFIIWLKAESFAEEERLLDELNEKILEQFNRAGLEFAYPTRTLLIARSSPPK